MTINENAQQALQRQKLLLQMEYYAEKEAFRKQTEVVGMQRKVKRGDAWFPPDFVIASPKNPHQRV